MPYVKAFGKFWYHFIVGEDWRIAAGVAGALAAGALLASGDVMSDTLLVVLVAVAIVVVVVACVVGTAIASRSARIKGG
jgi:hypothetical protein